MWAHLGLANPLLHWSWSHSQWCAQGTILLPGSESSTDMYRSSGEYCTGALSTLTSHGLSGLALSCVQSHTNLTDEPLVQLERVQPVCFLYEMDWKDFLSTPWCLILTSSLTARSQCQSPHFSPLFFLLHSHHPFALYALKISHATTLPLS
jgi:hypothetical protein